MMLDRVNCGTAWEHKIVDHYMIQSKHNTRQFIIAVHTMVSTSLLTKHRDSTLLHTVLHSTPYRNSTSGFYVGGGIIGRFVRL